ncbi:MAG: sulfurtransferase complex subunit TusB [Nitrospirota bacterium]|jgi:sulfur relay protein TusB/DsrH
MKLGVFVSDYSLTADTLERLKADDLGIILVLNGVYHAALKENGQPSPVLEKSSKIYVLSEDLQTRGIEESAVDSRAKVVTYGDLVDVMMNDYEKLAWL